MKKYLRTSLVLGLITAICATLIVLVNMLTTKIIEKNHETGKSHLYKEIFTEYSAAKSEVITEGFASKFINEKVLARDSANKDLGYIYTVAGKNDYGDIELMVGITSDIKLKGAKFITNGQSFSAEANRHLTTQYKPNMTLEEIMSLDLTNSDVTAGATYASKLIRDLVSAAFKDAKNEGFVEEENPDLYKSLFSDFSASKSEIITSGFISQRIVEKIIARDDSGKDLGYLYKVAGENRFGAIELLVGITLDFKLKGVKFITNGQSYADKAEQHLNEQYKADMTIDDVNDLDLSNKDVTAGATRAAELIKELVTAAFEDADGKKLALIKEIFSKYSAEKSETITSGFDSESILEKIEVLDDNGNELGYLYTVVGENKFGVIELLVGITPDLKLKGVKFLTNGQSYAAKAEQHLNSQYKPDMTVDDVNGLDLGNKDVTAGATRAAELIKELVNAAFADAGKKLSLSKEIFSSYSAAKSGVVTSGFKSESIREKIVVKDDKGADLGYLYTVVGENKFGVIELLVGITPDLKLKGVKFLTNGQSYSAKAEQHLNEQYKPDMTYEGVTGLELNGKDVTAGATFAAQLIKELVSAAFEDASQKLTLSKEIFDQYSPLQSAVYTSGLNSKNILERVVVKAENGNVLGYLYTVEGENKFGKIVLLVGVTQDLKLKGVKFIVNGQSYSSKAEQHLNNQYKEGMTLDGINGLDLTNKDVTAGATFAAQLIKELVNAAFEDASKKLQLSKDIFGDFSVAKSEITTSGFSAVSILEKIAVKDESGSVLGYLYTVEGENKYGKIVLLVGVTKDLKLKGVKFITNGQSFSKQTEQHLNSQYKEGMTLDGINDLDLDNRDVTAKATYAAKLIRELVTAAFEDTKAEVESL